MNGLSHPLEQATQARRDLAELDQQVAAGEIHPEDAARLRATYLAELEEAQQRAAEEEAPTPPAPAARSGKRVAVGAGILVAVLAVVVAVAAQSVQERQGPLEGVAAGAEEFDPASYSNETLEAVIAANRDHPQIHGMRIALADRYLEEGDLQAAFPHYQEVIEADPPAPAPELATAFARLGWIVYLGNGEVELATGMLDRALEVLPGDPVATYLKAQVRWCGAGDAAQAAELLRAVLSSPQLDDALRAQVAGELAAAEAGEPCP